MSWDLFLSPNGRIGRQNFWIAWLILFAVGFVVSLIPRLNIILPLVLIYPKVCIYSKRFHDMGKSGWLQAIPYGLWIVCSIAAIFVSVPAFIEFGQSANMENPTPQQVLTLLAGMGGGLLFILAASIVSLVFWLWAGIAPSQPGPNMYDPESDTAVMFD